MQEIASYTTPTTANPKGHSLPSASATSAGRTKFLRPSENAMPISRRTFVRAFPFFGAAVAMPAAAIEVESTGDRIKRLVSELHEAVSAQYGNQFATVIDADGQLWLRNADDMRADREVIDAALTLKRAQRAENEAYAAYSAEPKVLALSNSLYGEYQERNVAKNDALTDLLQIIWRDL